MNSTDIKKIAIGGAIQIGKSTLVERLTADINIPISGFCTKLDRGHFDENGMFPLYIYPASVPPSERKNSADNYLGACAGKNRHKAYTERFDRLATSMIENVPMGNVIIMDELGFLESEAERFKQKVKEILAQDRYIIMVIKERFDVPFLNELRGLSDVSYYTVTEQNREFLYRELSGIVGKWKA